MRRALRSAAIAALCLTVPSLLTASSSRLLSFDERVEAQRAIERVYFGHLEGSRRTFEQAVTTEVLQREVRAYLEHSAALAARWSAPITGQMLRAEAERIARSTRYPGRLSEIEDALGGDTFLIQETLVRAALAERLVRSFYAFDGALHAAGREAAERMHEELQALVVDTASLQGAPASTRVQQTAEETGEPGGIPAGAALIAVGPVQEQAGSFTIRVKILGADGATREEDRAIAKVPFETWWAAHAPEFDSGGVTAVASSWSGIRGALAGVDASGCAGPDRWDNGILDDVPDPRYGHAAVWTGTEMIVYGGRVDEYPLLPVTAGRYDPLSDTWRGVSRTGAPEQIPGMTAVWTGSEMIVWGGADFSGRYDPATDTWSPLSTDGQPSLQLFHTAVWTGSEMIVFGGMTSTMGGSSGDTAGGARYNPVNGTWTPLPAAGAPGARQRHTAVWTGSAMIIWGGEFVSSGAGTVRLGDGALYDISADSWAPLPATGAPTPRVEHTAVWSGTEMIVWGGIGSDFPNGTGARYNPATGTWLPTTGVNAPAARRAHAAVWTGSRMIVARGTYHPSRYAGVYVNAAQYDPASDTWTTVPDAQFSASLASAVWTGDRMILWGGAYDSVGPIGTATGDRYDPVTGAWTPVSPVAAGGVPVSYLSSAVWTGTEMIAWSTGPGGPGTPGTGGRYDPMLDSWRSVSIQNAPGSRQMHVAVWTGDEMIVWGGSPNLTLPLNDGGRYDPVSDTWRATSLDAAPGPRVGARAVWTGREMLVWGGYIWPNGAVQGRGGLYDPLLDRWRAVSEVASAPGVSGHTLIWTGTEAIAFGGRPQTCAGEVGCTFGLTDRGARYDPATDVWRPLPPIGGGQGRAWHAAVWTGHSMIVTGGAGVSFDPPFFYGWEYDRAADAWTSLPEREPVDRYGRVGHTALWTGSRVLIFGDGDARHPGEVFDTATATWTPLPLDGAPGVRSGHAAVWTGDSMLLWGGAPYFSGGRLILGQTSDDDGDGLSECDGDCDDTRAAARPGAAETCNGQDDSCDGVVDEDAAGVDSDQDGTPNACDVCPSFANPGQDEAFVCGRSQGDGACLTADIELAPPLDGGGAARQAGKRTIVTLLGSAEAAPSFIQFESNISSCFRIDPVDFYLNGEMIARFVEPTATCDCVPPVYRIQAADAARLAGLWRMDQPNEIRFVVPGPDADGYTGTSLGWLRVRIGPGADRPGEAICLYDAFGGDCTQLDVCHGGWNQEPLDLSVPVEVELHREHEWARITPPIGGLTGRVDLQGIPDGDLSVCVEPDWSPALLAAGSEDELFVLETGTGAASPAGHLPFGPRAMAHDEATRRTWAHASQGRESAISEVDPVTGTLRGDSPFLGRALSGLEWYNDFLFALESSTEDPRLIRFSPDTGADQVVLHLAAGAWAGLAHDASIDVFYAARLNGGQAELWSLDVERGTGALLGGLPVMPTDLEFGPDGLLYAVAPEGSDTALHLVDPSAPSMARIGPTGHGSILTLTRVVHAPRGCFAIHKQGERTLAINTTCSSAPMAIAGEDLTAECTSPGGAPVSLDGSASQADGGIAAYDWIESPGTPDERLLGSGVSIAPTLALGAHVIRLVVSDAAGQQATDDLLVTVADTQPPIVTVTTDPIVLWPPNHRMVSVRLDIAAVDACDPSPRVTQVSLDSSEPVDAPGEADGHTEDDIQPGADPAEWLLRAERSGDGAGRLYAVACEAADATGNTATATAGVVVPHDQSGTAEPIDLTVTPDRVLWTGVPGARSYNVLRVPLRGLSAVGSFTTVGDAVCAGVTADTTLDGAAVQEAPRPGEIVGFLVESCDSVCRGYGTATAGGDLVVVSGDSCHGNGGS